MVQPQPSLLEQLQAVLETAKSSIMEQVPGVLQKALETTKSIEMKIGEYLPKSVAATAKPPKSPLSKRKSTPKRTPKPKDAPKSKRKSKAKGKPKRR